MATRRFQRGGATSRIKRIGGRRYGRVSRSKLIGTQNRRRILGRRRFQEGGLTRSIVNGNSGNTIRTENQVWRCPPGTRTITADCIEETTIHQAGGGNNGSIQKRSHKRRRHIRPARYGR